MKFRPRVQIQVRSEDQLNAIKDKAASFPSVNEFILQAVEKVYPDLREEEEGSAPANKKVHEKKTKSEGSDKPCDECHALVGRGGMHQRGCSKAKKK